MVQIAALLPFDTDHFYVSFAVNSRWLPTRHLHSIYDFPMEDRLSLGDDLMDLDYTLSVLK